MAAGSQSDTAHQLVPSGNVYRELVGQMDDIGVLFLDREGTVLTWNAGAEKIMGYAAGDISRPELQALLPR